MCMLMDKVALESILFRTLWFYPVGIILLIIYVLSLKPDLLLSATDNGLK